MAREAERRPEVKLTASLSKPGIPLFFELNVGKGRVFVCMSDLTATQQYPESRHLLRSILEYMQSEDFKPAITLLPDDFGRFFTEKAQESNVSELRNISYD